MKNILQNDKSINRKTSKISHDIRRGSRGAACAAKSLRWRVQLFLKYLIKKLKALAIHQFLCLYPLLLRQNIFSLNAVIKTPIIIYNQRKATLLFKLLLLNKEESHFNLRNLILYHETFSYNSSPIRFIPIVLLNLY